MNASVRRMQFCMALNSYHFFKNIQNISLTYFHHCAIMDSALLCGTMLICHAKKLAFIYTALLPTQNRL